MAQYQRWLDRIRYACTYHHAGWTDWVKDKIPNIPLINPSPDPLAPPKRSPVHQHPNFDFGWGCGPIVDSFTALYYLNGSVTRVPGHCDVEVYDPEEKEYKRTDINGYGETNEYIHPICYYRRLIRGVEKQSPLNDFERTFEVARGRGGKGRFWWRKKGDTRMIPEWIILPDVGPGEVNFERTWYAQCEKTKERLAKLAENGYKKDWLETLDDVNDFSVGDKKGWEYP
jgi:hypothetical protein